MTQQTSIPLSSFADGVRALVVGSSRGIGLQLASQLAASPSVARVFAAARQPHDCEPLVALQARHGEIVSLATVDVTEEDNVEAAARAITASVAGLDLVVNCAGLLQDGAGLTPERKLAQVDPVNLERLFRIHAVGPLLLAKHLQPLFSRRERVVFASLSARVGSVGDNRLGGWYAYRMSKAAHNMAIRNLSIELARRYRGIVCLSLHPGTVETDLSAPFRSGVPKEKLFSASRAARQLLGVIDSRTPQDNGGFFAWDGSAIPW